MGYYKEEWEGNEWVGAKCDNCGEIWEHWHEGWTLMPDELALWPELDDSNWIHGDMIDNVVLPKENLYCDQCYMIDENDNTLLKELPNPNNL